jgi:hypothetical protein
MRFWRLYLAGEGFVLERKNAAHSRRLYVYAMTIQKRGEERNTLYTKKRRSVLDRMRTFFHINT